MTSLCGLTIAACGEPKSVTLTDGNQTSVENLKKICSENDYLVMKKCKSKLLKILQFEIISNYNFAV